MAKIPHPWLDAGMAESYNINMQGGAMRDELAIRGAIQNEGMAAAGPAGFAGSRKPWNEGPIANRINTVGGRINDVYQRHGAPLVAQGKSLFNRARGAVGAAMPGAIGGARAMSQAYGMAWNKWNRGGTQFGMGMLGVGALALGAGSVGSLLGTGSFSGALGGALAGGVTGALLGGGGRALFGYGAAGKLGGGVQKMIGGMSQGAKGTAARALRGGVKGAAIRWGMYGMMAGSVFGGLLNTNNPPNKIKGLYV